MPLPLIVVVPALVALGGGGVAAGVDGADRLADAHKRGKEAGRRQTKAFKRVRAAEDDTHASLRAYGDLQEAVRAGTLVAFVAWLEENRRRVGLVDVDLLAGLDLPVHVLSHLDTDPAVVRRLLADDVTSVIAAAAARQAALSGVQALAAASTGTAIASLSGAAAESATLAWIGGGTLAAGGTGVAGGALVLTGIGIAPAVLLGGLSLGKEGRKAQTRVTLFEAEVAQKLAHWKTLKGMLRRLRKRVRELSGVLTGLAAAARDSLARLKAVDFDPDNVEHLRLFQETALLMRSVREVLRARLFDESGGLAREGQDVAVKYRTYAKKAEGA